LYVLYQYFIQYIFICRPSENAGIEPRIVATLTSTVRRSNHSARCHPQRHNSNKVQIFLTLSICGSECEDVLAVVVVVPRGGAQVARPLRLLHQLTFEHVGGGEWEGGVLAGEEVDLHSCCCYSLPGPMLLVCNQ
jgi:hypothetical protein